jgi:N-formylglutamate amidohydrolase
MSQTKLAHQQTPFLITLPHSGEKVPAQTPWLNSLPEEILMSDVDRFVDILYKPVIESLQISSQKTQWHRYAVDLNRFPTDVDQDSVLGAEKKSGSHTDGYHWVMTKNEVRLMPQPMSLKNHEELTQLIFEPFHEGIRNHYAFYEKLNFKKIYHIDAHSMPSLGTRMHKDPGERRADLVVSDCFGKSCSKEFSDLVIAAYVKAGFKVGYNWPYMGGRLTEFYGKPQVGHHVIQVELNRSLYMDEQTKKINSSFVETQNKITKAIESIYSELANLTK